MGASTDDIDHLFRQEAGRMVATVTRVFGVHNLALAEDVVQDAFCRALDVWSIRGLPENPAAWLTAAARHRALDVLRRDRTARNFAPELGRILESEWTLAPTVAELFDAGAIQDALLRMMFSCCHPRLAEEAQVALMLNILCGFTVDEVAGAFVSGHDAIEKRITRAKKTLAGSKNLFDLGVPDDFSARLPAVQRALYLLFNEGYHGASPEFAVRAELCHEAMRLTGVLLEHPLAATPDTHALAALMSFNAARLPGRIDAGGNLYSLFDQDRSLWDQNLIARAQQHLADSASGDKLSEYHIEAAIASFHAAATRPEETNWAEIVSLYDTLMQIRPSPIIALNRAIAIGQHAGPQRGLEELIAIEGSDRLKSYPFYPAALGDFELRRGNYDRARIHFQTAVNLARNDHERRYLEQRAAACDGRAR